MRGMRDHLTIGERVAFYRHRRRLSQEVLAGMVDRTSEWLRKIETGRTQLDRLSVIRQLAQALDVSLADLIGEPSLYEWTDESGQQTVPALRAVLMDYRHVSPLLALADESEPPNLDPIQQEVTWLWHAYQASRYGMLARRLPPLLGDVVAAARIYNGDAGRRAQQLSAYAYQIATLLLTKLGEVDLAWTASNRGLAAAEASENHVVVGSLFRSVAHALAANGDYAAAVALVEDATAFLRPVLTSGTPEVYSVAGSLHLVGGLAAARADDRAASTAHLNQADRAAGLLGGDANHLWTAFGPTNVAIHRVAAAMELGDLRVATQLGQQVDTSALPIERRVRHAIEVARAHARLNRVDDALQFLLNGEQLAAEQVRYHYLSREVVRGVLRQPRPPQTAIDLGTRMGVVPR